MQTATFRALGEPNRLAIVELLRSGQRPVGDIVDQLERDQPHVSKHLRVLSDSGLVVARQDGRRRIYGLESEPFVEMQEWIDTFEHTWAERLDRLDAFLRDDGLQGDGC